MALCVATAACQRDGLEAETARLSADVTSVEVDANGDLYRNPFSDEPSVLNDTVMVSSSRSWTVAVKTEDGGNWVRLSLNERLNVSGTLETVPLVLTFDRYKGSQDRKATMTIYAADMAEPLVIPVVQKAFVPVLEVSSDGAPAVVPSIGGQCYMMVKSNTGWTASVDESRSTVVPVLSMLEGEGSHAVLLTFPDNANEESARIATLLVKAQGCEDCVLEFVQNQSDRFFLLADQVPSVLEPYESELHIPLRSNGAWTATLSDCTFENAVLQPSSGSQALNGFNFYADHGSDPTVSEKKATITISREGMEDIVLSIRQKGSIHLSFCEFNPEYVFDGRFTDPNTPYKPYISKSYPFSSPTSVPKSFSVGTLAGQVTDCIMTRGGFVFTMFGGDCGIWFDATAFGWCVGKMKDDYVLFPALEGYRLAEMYYEASCRASNPYTVRTEDGVEVIKGGEVSFTERVVPVVSNHHDMHVHVFPDTDAGARYRLNLEEDYRMISIKDLCLVYEKVN